MTTPLSALSPAECREMDTLIADKVMGWTDVCTASRKVHNGDTWFVPHGRPDREVLRYMEVPRFSSDPIACTGMERRIVADGKGEEYAAKLAGIVLGLGPVSFTDAVVLALITASPAQRVQAAIAVYEQGGGAHA